MLYHDPPPRLRVEACKNAKGVSTVLHHTLRVQAAGNQGGTAIGNSRGYKEPRTPKNPGGRQ